MKSKFLFVLALLSLCAMVAYAVPQGGGGGGSSGGGGGSSCSNGGVVAHNFLNSLSSGCSATLAQPSCADLSNGVASCSTDTTNASNISSGTLPNARIAGWPLLTYYVPVAAPSTLFLSSSANALNILGFVLPAPVSLVHFAWVLNTNDASAAHHYDLGIYNSVGTLVADTGQITLTGSTGLQSSAFISNAGCTGSGTPSVCCSGAGTGTCPASPLVLAPGTYFWATTGDNATVAIQDVGGTSAGYLSPGSITSSGVSSSGILPASATMPTPNSSASTPDIGLTQ